MYMPRNRSFHNLLVPLAGKKAGLLIHDGFTDSNGVHIHDHTISPVNSPSAVWTSSDNYAIINSNRISLVQSDRYGYGFLDPGVSDHVITATVHLYPGWSIFVLFARYTNSQNYWTVRMMRHPSVGYWDILEVKLGINTTRASGTPPPTTPATYAFEAIFDGTNISATYDGANEISYALAAFNQTVTPVGLCVYQAGADPLQFWLDDFKVTAL